MHRLYTVHPEWPQTDQAKNDFKQHVTKRVMNAIDHFQKAFCKTKPAKWAADLLAGKTPPADECADTLIIDDPIDDEVKEADTDIPAAQDTFFYGWSNK